MDIETSRLILRKISNDHTESLFEVFSDPVVMRYWVGGADNDIKQTKQRIEVLLDHWETHGFGDWAVILKDDFRLIGFSGLHFIDDMEEVNIGYAYLQSVWRYGYAYEACKAVIQFGFNMLNLEQIVAVIWPENLASINLAKKCGLQYLKDIIWKGSARVVYSIEPRPKRQI